MAAGSTAVSTIEPGEVVRAGQAALKGDSRSSDSEWNEFFRSRTSLFQSMRAYVISFDYKILARAGDAEFYTLIRRTSSQSADIGQKEWQGKPRDIGHIEVSAVVRHADDYYLIIGIHHKGAIAISNLRIAPDPPHNPIDVNLPIPHRVWHSPGATKYYIDSIHGSDFASGRSPAQAWKSLSRVNTGDFAPGDSILLCAGSVWHDYLSLGGSGAAGKPITIGTYGHGPKPAIDAQGRWLATVLILNSEHVTVRGLDIANHGNMPQPRLAAVEVSVNEFGTAHGIDLNGLTIHDVTGSNIKSEGGGSGIHCSASGQKTHSRFDGLVIENCRLTHTDRDGITLSGNSSRSDWYPNLHVVIRNNLLEDIGGDGIVPTACDGALIERNVLRGGRRRADDYAAGIWPWSCDNTVIQYNEVSGMRGTKDGEGFDSDWNCRNSLFQYNYSHDNEGGFMLICCDGSSPPSYSVGNVGTVIRYNVSVDDGSLRTFNITGPCTHTFIYNNTTYIGKGRDVKIVTGGNWGGSYPDDTRLINNVFYVAGKAKFDLGGMTNVTFDHNGYWGDVARPSADVNAVTSRPRLAAPGGASPISYRPLAGSPYLSAGAIIGDNGARDFASRSVPADKRPTIGAFQIP